MNKIISTSQAQREISKISSTIEETTYIVTSHGKGKVVMLPYFDGCNEEMEEYMETFEMMKNKKALQKRYQKSSESSESSLSI